MSKMGFDRDNNFRNLKFKDIILLSDGTKAEFVRHKVKNFVAIFNGENYNVPNAMYVETIEKAEKSEVPWYADLKCGDVFYIIKGGKDCVAFRFDSFEKGRIIGRHLLTNAIVRIDNTFDGGKIELA